MCQPVAVDDKKSGWGIDDSDRSTMVKYKVPHMTKTPHKLVLVENVLKPTLL